jgi:formate--tetrahydrofolate ligase
MTRSIPQDIEIAKAAKLKPIDEVAGELRLKKADFEPYGRNKAKVSLDLSERPAKGRLVLVTAINPTPAGEGKSTLAVGLAQALYQQGEKVVLCLREPSLGPVFGIKGGAAGGGYAQVLPMEDINLHFTGDLHAITSAHALLAAALDNHIHQGNGCRLDVRRIVWRRAVDMNDRALRNVVLGLGGPTSGVPREDGFVITAASEVMAVFCLSKSLADMTKRLGRIVIGFTATGEAVRARDIGVEGAMAVLLRDALSPNLVQTLGGGPAFVHGGPFGNIAHGCNSIIATQTALGLGEIVVTEAGFGADLGAEKFFNIKCRVGGLKPEAAVVVATARALRHHGGVAKEDLTKANPQALKEGLANLEQHIEIVKSHGVPPLVAVNRFDDDTDEEFKLIADRCAELGVPCVSTEVWARGAEGGLELADAVKATLAGGKANFQHLYPTDASIKTKVDTIATRVYGADHVEWAPTAVKQRNQLEGLGFGELPVCMAKTQYSLSDDATLRGRPEGFHVTVRELSVSAGAGFVIAYCGNIMTMPGLSKEPAAVNMRLNQKGEIEGLF